MTLARYLLKLIGSRILAATLILIAILQILDLLDVTTDILDRKLGLAGMGTYMLLRLPRLIEQAAPLGVLAGSLFAFAQLARENAVVALRATGMSAYRLTAVTAPAALVVVALQLAVSVWIAPHTDRSLETWWRDTTPKIDQKVRGPETFRLGADIVTASPGDENGKVLKDVTIYRRDAQGRLVQRTRAATATYGPQGWTLQKPTFESFSAAGSQLGSATEMVWTNRLHPSDAQSLFSNEPSAEREVSERALEGGASSRPASFYRTQLQRSWAAPVAALVMLFLAAPSLLATFRGGQGATLVVASLMVGLLFLVVDGVFVSIGESGGAPAVLAAWGAPAIFAAWGLTALLYLEG